MTSARLMFWKRKRHREKQQRAISDHDHTYTRKRFKVLPPTNVYPIDIVGEDEKGQPTTPKNIEQGYFVRKNPDSSYDAGITFPLPYESIAEFLYYTLDDVIAHTKRLNRNRPYNFNYVYGFRLREWLNIPENETALSFLKDDMYTVKTTLCFDDDRFLISPLEREFIKPVLHPYTNVKADELLANGHQELKLMQEFSDRYITKRKGYFNRAHPSTSAFILNKAPDKIITSPTEEIVCSVTFANAIAARKYVEKQNAEQHNVTVLYYDNTSGLLCTDPPLHHSTLSFSACHRRIDNAIAAAQIISLMKTGECIFDDDTVFDICDTLNYHVKRGHFIL